MIFSITHLLACGKPNLMHFSVIVNFQVQQVAIHRKNLRVNHEQHVAKVGSYVSLIDAQGTSHNASDEPSVYSIICLCLYVRASRLRTRCLTRRLPPLGDFLRGS